MADTTPVLPTATDPRSVGDAIRAVIAGSGAARVIASSVALFEAGGKSLLDQGAQQLVRSAAERTAETALAAATGPLLGTAAVLARKPIELLATSAKTAARTTAKNAGSAARLVGPAAARVAGKELLKGAGRAAGIGLVVDGAVAGVEAVVAVRNGSMDRTRAFRYVAAEAATGAVATGTGVLLGAGLVALTGGIAAPVVFAVGAIGAIGTKRLLRRFTFAKPEVTAREIPTVVTA